MKIPGKISYLALIVGICLSATAHAADREYSAQEWKDIIESHWEENSTTLYGVPFSVRRTLMLGMQGEDIGKLRAHLATLGFASSVLAETRTRFDDTLASAVKSWQDRMGLEADGIVGPRSRAVLANPGSYARSLLDDALDRGPRKFRDTEVYVDIVAQHVEARIAGEVIFEGPVIVGKREHATPEVTTRIEGITINPPWYVPPGIFQRTKLERLLTDPQGLIDEGFIAFERVEGKLESRDVLTTDWSMIDPKSILLVQRTSEISALGKFKFEMPNRYLVFLHDTPEKGLFASDDRLYSSGCVRVQDIDLMTKRILGDDIWQDKAIDERLTTNRTLRLKLDETIPVTLDYRVATIINGRVDFREDIYRRFSLPLPADGIAILPPMKPQEPATTIAETSIAPIDMPSGASDDDVASNSDQQTLSDDELRLVVPSEEATISLDDIIWEDFRPAETPPVPGGDNSGSTEPTSETDLSGAGFLRNFSTGRLLINWTQ